MPVAATAVVKSSLEQRYTLGLAYPADKLDGHGEYMKADELEQVAWDYVAKHREVGLFHVDGTVGRGTVVESYIYRGPDWELTPAGSIESVVIKSGDWLLGVQWDEVGWRLYQEGYIDGLSIQGKAVRVASPIAA